MSSSIGIVIVPLVEGSEHLLPDIAVPGGCIYNVPVGDCE